MYYLFGGIWWAKSHCTITLVSSLERIFEIGFKFVQLTIVM